MAMAQSWAKTYQLFICNSYTIPTRAVRDLLPEPEDKGNKSDEGVWYSYFKAYYGNVSALI